jgi:glyoxylase-like metal-dependent hydrolase (beta-lactamase superfamily II)
MEIVDGIHRIEAPLGERVVCSFLIVGDGDSILVDTGIATTPAETLLPYLAAVGESPRTVVISHADFDHHGGNAVVAAALPRARFACHGADRQQIEDVERLIAERYNEFERLYGIPSDPATDASIRRATGCAPIAVELADGDALPVGSDRLLDVLHVPGHSRGHIALLDTTTRTVIAADAVLHEALRTQSGAPAFPPTYRYVDEYRDTIARLRELHAERLLTSHFPAIEGGAAIEQFLDESEAYVDLVEQALVTELGDAPHGLTMAQLIERLGPALGDWPSEASGLLCHPLAGHIERLRDTGALTFAAQSGAAPVFQLQEST